MLVRLPKDGPRRTGALVVTAHPTTGPFDPSLIMLVDRPAVSRERIRLTAWDELTSGGPGALNEHRSGGLSGIGEI